MTPSTLLPFLLLLTLRAIAQTESAYPQVVSQISDGQVQAVPSVGPAPPDITLTEEETTSTTSQTLTTSATISLPLQPALNSSGTAVAPLLPSTPAAAAVPVPTSILLAAPANAPGAASNYTGLETVEAAAASLPAPRVPIPVNATAVGAGGLNSSAVATTALAPTTTASEGEGTGGEEEAASTTTEAPVAATGAGVRVCGALGWKGVLAAGVLVWGIGFS